MSLPKSGKLKTGLRLTGRRRLLGLDEGDRTLRDLVAVTDEAGDSPWTK